MTTKNLRDILAYYSDSVSCSYWLRSESGTYHTDTWLSEFMHEITGNGIDALNDNVSDFKLQLRPITSLTDEEAYTCYDLAFGSDATLGKPHGVNRDEEKLEVYAYDRADYGRRDLSIWLEDGQMAATGYRHYVQDLYSPIWSPSSLIAYLQSINIYIPGTIDERYVQLIP